MTENLMDLRFKIIVEMLNQYPELYKRLKIYIG